MTIELIDAWSYALAITAVAEPIANPPRIKLTVTSSPEPGSPVIGPVPVTVWRIHADGSKYAVLSDAALAATDTGGVWAGFDYHPPFGVPVRYQAQVGERVSAVTDTVRLRSSWHWITHPSLPELSLRPEYVAALGPVSIETRSGVFPILGSQRPVTTWDRTGGGGSSTLTFGVLARDLRAVADLFREGGPLLLNLAGGAGWDVSWLWIQPTGTVEVSNPGSAENAKGGAGHPFRVVTFGYVVVDQPYLTPGSVWTYDDLPTTFASYREASEAYTSYLGLRLNVRGG